MSNTETVILSGAHLGVVKLRQFIALLEDSRTPESVVRRIKTELHTRGDRATVLRAARECLANVANW